MSNGALPPAQSVPEPYTLKIKNGSSVFTNDQIYIFAKGENVNYGTTAYPPEPIPNIPDALLHDGVPITNVDTPVPTAYELVEAVIAFDTDTGIGTVTSIPSKDTNASDFTYKLSDFAASGDVTLQIPALNSGRLYISIGQALRMKVTQGLKTITITSGDDAGSHIETPDTLTFIEPNGADKHDPDYPILFDKIEFSYNEYGSWIDTTSVDFYAIPLSLRDAHETKGLTQSRKTVLDALSHLPADWSKLTVHPEGEILRVLAPQKLCNEAPFDSFFNEYINAVWDYYSDAKGNKLTINCQELKGPGDAYNYTGSVNASDEFVFTIDDDTQVGGVFTKTCSINGKPTSGELLLCKGGPLDTTNKTLISVLVKTLSAAMNAGLLPLADNPTLYDKHFTAVQKESFYQENPILATQYPGVTNSYNLYAKILHSFDEGIYAFPFDDVLGQDSTIHLEPSEVTSTPVTLTIGDMQGTALPSHQDSTIYTAEITVGDGAHGSITNNAQVTTPLVKTPQPITVNELSSPFTFTYNNGNGDQQVTVDAALQTITQGMGSVEVSGSTIKLFLSGKAAPAAGTKTGVQNGVPLTVVFTVGGAGAHGYVDNTAKTPLVIGKTALVTVEGLVSPFTIHYDAGHGLNQYSIDAANNTSTLDGVVVTKGADSTTANVVLPGMPAT